MSLAGWGAPELLALALAFALGSVLGGQIVGHLRALNLRESGSGNLGATNMLRAGGSGPALLVLAIDAGKGALASSVIPLWLPQQALLPYACGLAAVLGHVYSPLAGGRGGKGAATALGSAVVLLPAGVGFAAAGFALLLIASGYVGLSMVCASLLLLLHTTCFSAHGFWSPAGAYAAALALLLLWTHRHNLARNLAGRENRFERVMLLRRRSRD